MLEIELFDHLIVWIYKMSLQIIYLIYMFKDDLALNNQQWLIYHETKPHQTTVIIWFQIIISIS